MNKKQDFEKYRKLFEDLGYEYSYDAYTVNIKRRYNLDITIGTIIQSRVFDICCNITDEIGNRDPYISAELFNALTQLSKEW